MSVTVLAVAAADSSDCAFCCAGKKRRMKAEITPIKIVVSVPNLPRIEFHGRRRRSTGKGVRWVTGIGGCSFILYAPQRFIPFVRIMSSIGRVTAQLTGIGTGGRR